MSHHGPCQRHQTTADPSNIHEKPSQDEEWDSEHRKRVHTSHDLLRDDYERQVRSYDDNASGTREGETNRDSSQHQPSERTEKEATHQFVPLVTGSSSVGSGSPPNSPGTTGLSRIPNVVDWFAPSGSSLSSDLANRWTTISTPATGTEA